MNGLLYIYIYEKILRMIKLLELLKINKKF